MINSKKRFSLALSVAGWHYLLVRIQIPAHLIHCGLSISKTLLYQSQERIGLEKDACERNKDGVTSR